MRPSTLAFIIISLALSGCGPYSQNARVVGSPGTQVSPIQEEYRIHVGDKLAVRLFYNPDLNQEVTVRPDGKVSLLLVHELSVAGLTTSQLTDLLTEKYAKDLQQPEVAVIVNSFAAQRVFVGGEVGQPGAKDIIGPTTVIQAVALAGGFKDTARTDEVIVMRRDEENKPFLIALDIKKAMKGIDLNQDIYVQPYDMVLVPKSNIADVDLWVNQYINSNISGDFGTFFMYYYYTK
jgi:protein involved in polysaccharide export with SLBB domain